MDKFYFSKRYIIVVVFCRTFSLIVQLSLQRKNDELQSYSEGNCCLMSKKDWSNFPVTKRYPEHKNYLVNLIYVKILENQRKDRLILRDYYSKNSDKINVYFVLSVDGPLTNATKEEFQTYQDLIIIQSKDEYTNINIKTWVSIKHASLIMRRTNILVGCVALSNDDSLIHAKSFDSICTFTASKPLLLGSENDQAPALRHSIMFVAYFLEMCLVGCFQSHRASHIFAVLSILNSRPRIFVMPVKQGFRFLTVHTLFNRLSFKPKFR